ncbi:MAG TPA: glucose-1-phosphate adenylyltransferase [Blastocatellia bacterium]|jgi:glucose-1-phosphate adenylyltransferase|nr:glucose-1-phosphate adenylyltransferase [Blastocatellia bacterium]HAF25318.1 glucose-1-phosphate adenylyltransferase [Blastocatellia bacterium]HCX29853.1 glucose-1-phosphate adenylyltransferase [Blastocatellia bacterium]
MPAKHNLLAVILGGGAGTRLFPLTQQRSKPAVPLGGKYRLVDVAISNCINSDVFKMFVLTQYNSASLNRHLAQTYRFSPFSNGFVEVMAAEQTPESPQWFQGTADAVRQVLPHIRDWGIDTLLILSGDHLYRMDYRQFLARHYETDADVTVSVTPSDELSASEFGLLKTAESGRIVEFKEKPKGDELQSMRVDTNKLGLSEAEAIGRPFLASMGIYVFKYDRLEQLLIEDPNAVDFGRELIPSAINTANVQAYLFDGYWEDIGTISAFYRANLDLTSKIPKFNLFDAEAPVYTRARYLPPSKVEESQILDSILSDGCIVNGAAITNSVIGLRSRIGKGVRVDASFLMGADYYQTIEEMRADSLIDMPRVGIGEGTIINRAIIDKNARIGSGVQLVNDARILEADGENNSYYIRDGIIIVPKNAVIRDGTVV